MKITHHHLAQMDETLIIGAGPAGLAAGITLQRAGHPSVILERGDQVGGLMHSPWVGDVIADLGRKELYSRFPDVDALWSEALGDEYKPYPHRVGSLYHGRVVEMSGRYRGLFRGMPPHWVAAGGAGLVWGWLRSAVAKPQTYEAHWYSRVGPVFARILAQGYWEKFRGRRWAEMPPPDEDAGQGYGALSAARQAIRLARAGGMQRQEVWRHPLRGCGQLFETLADTYRDLGGTIMFGAEVEAILPEEEGGVSLVWRQGAGAQETTCGNVISSLAIEELFARLPQGEGDPPLPRPGPEFTRSVLLVYLVFEEPPRFPHAWIEVNDPALGCGRVVNFAAFGGNMVLEGKTALCVEFFCAGTDPLLARDRKDQIALALEEIAGAGLADPATLSASDVIILERTNAAASWREQQSAARMKMFERLEAYPSIYHVNRPGADWASLAGIQAARAIAADDRPQFDRVANPALRQVEGTSAS